jgi:hypothetical protein
LCLLATHSNVKYVNNETKDKEIFKTFTRIYEIKLKLIKRNGGGFIYFSGSTGYFYPGRR